MDRITGPILALDLATRTGFCVGLPGDKKPRSGSVVLKQTGEHRRIAFSNFNSWLDDEFRVVYPSLIVVEDILPLQAFKRVRSSTDNIRLQYGLHAIVEAVSWRYGLRIPVAVNPATVRKHFLGVNNMGDRIATKAAVIRRAQVLGFMPSDSFDDNRGDAISLWDYAVAHFAGRVPDELVMFESGRASKARRARAS